MSLNITNENTEMIKSLFEGADCPHIVNIHGNNFTKSSIVKHDSKYYCIHYNHEGITYYIADTPDDVRDFTRLTDFKNEPMREDGVKSLLTLLEVRHYPPVTIIPST